MQIKNLSESKLRKIVEFMEYLSETETEIHITSYPTKVELSINLENEYRSIDKPTCLSLTVSKKGYIAWNAFHRYEMTPQERGGVININDVQSVISSVQHLMNYDPTHEYKKVGLTNAPYAALLRETWENMTKEERAIWLSEVAAADDER